jgi:hypothetical protein
VSYWPEGDQTTGDVGGTSGKGHRFLDDTKQRSVMDRQERGPVHAGVDRCLAARTIHALTAIALTAAKIAPRGRAPLASVGEIRPGR